MKLQGNVKGAVELNQKTLCTCCQKGVYTILEGRLRVLSLNFQCVLRRGMLKLLRHYVHLGFKKGLILNISGTANRIKLKLSRHVDLNQSPKCIQIV